MPFKRSHPALVELFAADGWSADPPPQKVSDFTQKSKLAGLALAGMVKPTLDADGGPVRLAPRLSQHLVLNLVQGMVWVTLVTVAQYHTVPMLT
jgi:hypothetical protein